MSGTTAGGKKTAITNKLRYGEFFYKNIGRAGGQKSRNGGFSTLKTGEDGLDGPTRASVAGYRGGKNSWKNRKGKKS